MKKRTLALIMSLTLTSACLLPACGRADSNASQTSATEETAQTANEAAETAADADDAADTEAVTDTATNDTAYYENTVYGDLLDKYKTLAAALQEAAGNPDADLSSVNDLMDMAGAIGIQEYVNANPDTAMDNLGYRVEDLSGDGIPELLVAYCEDNPDYGPDNMVFALYTSVNEEPVSVIDSWYRNKYFLRADGKFGYYGSNGAASSGFGTCSLTEDGTGLIWDDFYFSDYADAEGQTIAYYHNTIGEWDPAASEVLDISDKEFTNLDEGVEAEQAALDLKSFADFASAGQ